MMTSSTEQAIAAIRREIAQLEKQGTERGSVQRHGMSYRLVWRQGAKVFASPVFPRSEKARYEALCLRYKRVQKLKKQLELMERLRDGCLLQRD